jgi:hypothetical protein
MSGDDVHAPRIVLASRENAGIRVGLLWARDTNALAVRVTDDSTADEFGLVVERGVDPIDAYEHPYAYAAWRGLPYRTASVLQPAPSEEHFALQPHTLALEATRYLEVLHLLRSPGGDVRWRPEEEELGPRTPPPQTPRPARCDRCGGPLARINGRHVCLLP